MKKHLRRNRQTKSQQICPVSSGEDQKEAIFGEKRGKLDDSVGKPGPALHSGGEIDEFDLDAELFFYGVHDRQHARSLRAVMPHREHGHAGLAGSISSGKSIRCFLLWLST